MSPIAHGLRVESQITSQGSWSFRSSREDFEYLWPIDDLVRGPFQPNLRQFLRHSPGVAKLVTAHDTALEALRTACGAALDRLASSEMLEQLHQEMQTWAAAHGGHDIPTPRHAAEYVVNGWRHLDHGWTGHDAWREFGAKFLLLRDHPSVRHEIEAVDSAGRRFAKALGKLSDAFEQEQQELADRFGLPAVSADDDVE